jgi:hypothetical protein
MLHYTHTGWTPSWTCLHLAHGWTKVCARATIGHPPCRRTLLPPIIPPEGCERALSWGVLHPTDRTGSDDAYVTLCGGDTALASAVRTAEAEHATHLLPNVRRRPALLCESIVVHGSADGSATGDAA